MANTTPALFDDRGHCRGIGHAHFLACNGRLPHIADYNATIIGKNNLYSIVANGISICRTCEAPFIATFIIT